MLRTSEDKEKPKIIGDFSGINDTVSEVHMTDNLVNWGQGGYFNTSKEFQRLCGKVPHTSNASTAGQVLTIAQLEFADHKEVVYHASTGYFTAGDLYALRSSTTDKTQLDVSMI